jgi:high-affinity Fe2+/Pb2+ permease
MNLIGDVAIVAVFWIVFLGWLLYRWLVKNDVSKYRHEVSTAVFFLSIMTFVYWLILV